MSSLPNYQHLPPEGYSKGIPEKKTNKIKTYTTVSLTMLKPLTVWITTNCGKFLKRWRYQTTLPVSRNLYAGQKATVRTDMEQGIGSKLGKDYVKAVYCHPASLA